MPAPKDLTQLDHPVFKFIRPTTARINRSVAWLAVCRRCGAESLQGVAQIIARRHVCCPACNTRSRRHKAPLTPIPPDATLPSTQNT